MYSSKSTKYQHFKVILQVKSKSTESAFVSLSSTILCCIILLLSNNIYAYESVFPQWMYNG